MPGTGRWPTPSTCPYLSNKGERQRRPATPGDGPALALAASADRKVRSLGCRSSFWRMIGSQRSCRCAGQHWSAYFYVGWTQRHIRDDTEAKRKVVDL